MKKPDRLLGDRVFYNFNRITQLKHYEQEAVAACEPRVSSDMVSEYIENLMSELIVAYTLAHYFTQQIYAKKV